MTVFSNEMFDATEQTCFFGKQVNIARYDKQRYNIFEKLTDKQLGFFWRPEEVDLSRDGKDFKGLTDHEMHIFTSNLKRQILLDSVQGRAPGLAFLPICSLPELETWIQTWTFSETIHSRSYTHIIRNVYSDPSRVFDEMLDIQEIADCAHDISKYYDDLIHWNHHEVGMYEHKKKLWLCLNAVNALEGVRFYVSFACSWAFAEVKKMEGNAKIIKLIEGTRTFTLPLLNSSSKFYRKRIQTLLAYKKKHEMSVSVCFLAWSRKRKVGHLTFSRTAP